MENLIRVFNILRQRNIILLMFVITGISSSLGFPVDTWDYSQLGVIVFPIIAWFAYKRQSLAMTATILLLLIMGSGFLYDGFLALVGKGDEFGWIHLVKSVTGIYLTWGALVLHRERRGLN